MVGDKMVFGQSLHEPSAEFDYPTAFKTVPDLPATKALLQIWESYEARGGMQMGRDIPSRELGKFLGNITIVEPIGDWEDSHVRLAGQILMLRFGRDVTGMRGSDAAASPEAAGAAVSAGGGVSAAAFSRAAWARFNKCSGISVIDAHPSPGCTDHNGPEMPPSLRTLQKWMAMKMTMMNGKNSTCSTYQRSSVSVPISAPPSSTKRTWEPKTGV